MLQFQSETAETFYYYTSNHKNQVENILDQIPNISK